MRAKSKHYFIMLALLCIGTGVTAQQPGRFKAGDRIAFLGNSITEAGHYHSYIWLYYMTHFPNERLTLLNVGVGGDNVKQMTDRFNYEVLPAKPTSLFITWGMNDTKYFEWNSAKADTLSSRVVEIAEGRYAVLDGLLKQHPEFKKVFILGSPYDETTKSNKQNYYPGKGKAFETLINFQQATAKKNGWPYVDFYHPMLAINQSGQATDSLFSITPGDRIHPDNDGHMVMAYLFLKAQGLAGLPVADFAVNATKKMVDKQDNCAISNLVTHKNGVSFDYLAQSLPYATDTIPRGFMQRKTQAEGLKQVPFTDEFNREILTVSGLQKGRYQLSIDNTEIGIWDAAELAKGINLATQIWTPQYQQAIQVKELNEQRWELDLRLRHYTWVEFSVLKDKGLLYTGGRAAAEAVNKTSLFKDIYAQARFKSVRDAWQKQQEVLLDAIYTINKPVTRKISLKRVN